MEINSLAERQFEHLALLRDPAIGLMAVVAVHDTRRGPAFGGIRRCSYPDLSAAIDDALRLAEAMTLKCAISDVPGGGGKTVLVATPDLDREEAYRAIGRAVAGLAGRYYTGPDFGTTARDLAAVALETECVARPDAGCGDLAVPTALGVFAGIRAVAERLGFDGVRGAHIAVQGLGEVGRRVVAHLASNGARLSIADVRAEVARDLAARTGATVCSPDHVVSTECDVFAPCALGGVIDAGALARLRARAIAGSANNVLANLDFGDALAQRGILYAPDFVISAGALIHGALFHLDGVPPPESRVLAIGDRIGEILDLATRADESTDRVARRLARERQEST